MFPGALLVPSKVTLKAGGARIWAGYHATFVLDNNDKMLAWGLNNYGQLGLYIFRYSSVRFVCLIHVYLFLLNM